MYGGGEHGARVQRQHQWHPSSLTGVRGHGRGVHGRGGVGHSEEERGGETIEGKVCCTVIRGFLARRVPVRLLKCPRTVAVALPVTTGHPKCSYRDALLSGGAPPVGRDISDIGGINLNQRLRYWRSKQHHCPASSPPPSSKPTMIPDEDWQVVKPRHVRCHAPSGAPRSCSPHYLATVEGKCFNCLSPSHRRANYCLPTRCFNFHGRRHHLRDYKRSRKSSIVVGVSDAVSQAPRDTLLFLGDGGTPSAPAPSVGSRFSKPNLIFPVESVCSIPCSWDPHG
jgi:hypothetical protein